MEDINTKFEQEQVYEMIGEDVCIISDTAANDQITLGLRKTQHSRGLVKKPYRRI